MKERLELDRDNLLRELEGSLRHLMCAGIKDDASRQAMETMVKTFMEEEAVKYGEQELMEKFDTTENQFKIFFGYLMAKGLVEVKEKQAMER